MAWHYIWPALRDQPGLGNLKLILLVHAFRFLALAFVVPVCCISGVTDQICSVDSLPRFRKRHSGFARTGYSGNPRSACGNLGLQYLRNGRPGYFILTAYVPVLLITHV